LARSIFWRGANRAKQITSKKKIFGVPTFWFFHNDSLQQTAKNILNFSNGKQAGFII